VLVPHIFCVMTFVKIYLYFLYTLSLSLSSSSSSSSRSCRSCRSRRSHRSHRGRTNVGVVWYGVVCCVVCDDIDIDIDRETRVVVVVGVGYVGTRSKPAQVPVLSLLESLWSAVTSVYAIDQS
jgi:hypothetical protein